MSDSDGTAGGSTDASPEADAGASSRGQRLARELDATGEVDAKVALLELRDSALDISAVYDAARDDAAGGVVLFVGAVRRHDAGKDVDGLGYSSHPTAPEVLRSVAREVAVDPAVVKVAAAHRTGDLVVGDVAVVVAVSSAHRGEAFVACRRLIDELKARVPIWKHQIFADGSDEWVGTP